MTTALTVAALVRPWLWAAIFGDVVGYGRPLGRVCPRLRLDLPTLLLDRALAVALQAAVTA